ncbi:autotransporter outer membrane beta-barrel domain-containing protein [Paragemmobacter straminiformis]|uniref:Autotransporter outer membrane beta-barrel domain-containing protein n=1 Tax=Paragemmobacter straminiformis TaxID=2045119 RepID=A0A842I694_9RHOB|nr:autotransporter outer membrane beta-barrel domain-containing protein [Gemmobacter straminiformis]MBC2835135.1 autotransporter outer membrane beta-barrel domain-containing protein [Gemmobacter straminiformis]
MTFASLLRGLLLGSTALGTITTAEAQDCLDFGIDQTCINSGNLPGGIIDDGSIDLTNTSTGTIYGAFSGVQTWLDGKVDNLGSIGSDTFGVLGFTGTLDVRNRGSIHGGAIAVFGIAGAKVSNSGDLSGIFGIFSTGDVTALNLGSIVGSQGVGDSYGILGNTVDIENRGLISGGFNGIGVGTSGRIVNSGSIVGTAVGPAYFSFGIMARGDLQLANSGTIQGEYGVSVNNSTGGTVIDNDGWIIGTDGIAIDMTGLSVSAATTASSGNSLILRGRSKIDGAILLGDGDTVRIETDGGMSRLVTFTGWEGEPADVTQLGKGVFVQDGETYATLDTTSFARQGQGLLALSQGIAAAAPQHGAQTPAGGSLSTKGTDGPTGWAGAFGASLQDDARDQTVASTGRTGGIVGGMTIGTQGGLTFGLFAGLGNGVSDVEGSSSTETDYRFAGLSVQGGDAAWFDARLIAGMTDSDSRRTVADNTIIGGLATGTASFAGDFAALHLGTGRDFHMGNVVWTPSLSLDAATGQFDGYTETGTAQDLTVDSRETTALSLRLGVERSESFELAGGTLGTVLSLALVSTNVSNDDIAGTLLGQSFVTGSGVGAQYTGVAIGSGLTFEMSPSASLSLRGEGVFSDGGLGGSGALALNVKF